ncbi:MAG TPA: 30S ribosomal protein S6 [Patescibacteria group bacterium]
MQYELFYLVGERQEANLDAIRNSVSAMLTQEGATILEEEIVEKRKLAYEIKHQNRGTYITRRFELPEVEYWADEKNAEKEFGIQAITNKLNLNNDVLRFLIVKTEDLPDLGAKQRRKEQELGNAKQAPVKAQRPEKKAAPKPEAKEAVKEEVKPIAEIKEEVKEEKVEETKVEEVKEAPKKSKKEAESKDIDKQLDELLNI